MVMKEVYVEYRSQEYSSLICEKITSTDEVRALLKGNNYFFGTVATNYDNPENSRAFFGSGPDHTIFELAVLKYVELGDAALQQCQISIRKIGLAEISTVMFKFDPARLIGNTSPDEQDSATSHRRIGIIKSLVGKLTPNVCDDKILIGSFAYDCPSYIYLPQTRQLLKNH